MSMMDQFVIGGVAAGIVVLWTILVVALARLQIKARQSLCERRK